MKRHQANIDLKRNVLVIADTETPFLSEADIPQGIFNPSASIGQQLGGGPLPSSNAETAKPPAATAAANAAASRSQSSTAPRTQVPQTANFDEETVNNLIGLGFSRQEVIRALQQTGGNAELAASILFS